MSHVSAIELEVTDLEYPQGRVYAPGARVQGRAEDLQVVWPLRRGSSPPGGLH